MSATDPCLKAASLGQVMSSSKQWYWQLKASTETCCKTWLRPPVTGQVECPVLGPISTFFCLRRFQETICSNTECEDLRTPKITSRGNMASRSHLRTLDAPQLQTSIRGQRKTSSWLWGWLPKFLLSDKLGTSPVCQRSWWEAWFPLSMGAWIGQRETQEKCPV